MAMAFVLAVTHPAMCGLGGGGHVLVRTGAGAASFFDFREQAPAAAARDMFADSAGDAVKGWRAAAVPGYVRGWDTIHRRFGVKPWPDLLRPAIRMAADGFALSWLKRESFRTILNLELESLVQPELARTLERIAAGGAQEFYAGETARVLAAQMAAHGGLITRTDLEAFRVAEPAPLAARYRGCEVITASGSSSGGVGLLQMLAVLESTGFERHGANSAAAIHFLAEAMRRFFSERAQYMGDPDFVTVPYSQLLSAEHVAALRASIDPERATPSSRLSPGALHRGEGANTTHFNVLDAEGNAVAATVTLNGQFGSCVTVPGLGFLLNNNMDNFAANPGKPNQYGLLQGEVNAIQPGKRPVSSMTPTMVLKDGGLFLIVGTPGGPTILNSVLQAVVNVIDFGMNAQDAVNAPRAHHQWYPDKLYLEPGFSPDTVALLEARGHEVEWRASLNDLNMILADGGWIQAAVDPRREGKAAGY